MLRRAQGTQTIADYSRKKITLTRSEELRWQITAGRMSNKGGMLQDFFADPSLPLVCIQGAGFVGSAMAVAVANARTPEGAPRFNVAAVELDTERGLARVQALNAETALFAAADPRLHLAHKTALKRRNLVATTEQAVYEHAAVAIVDVNLDVAFVAGRGRVNFEGFRAAIAQLGDRLPAGALLLVETTVPPGTCERVVVPTIAERLQARHLPPDAIFVAHSYERVMPGAAYLESITDFWRVYAGASEPAAAACAHFLAQIINTDAYPLTRLARMTASETGKILENSYRATTIAFMEEWSRFAERAGFDLFPVIDAIRLRPTHNNMRQPGFGVGGYCLTKDPLLAGIAAHDLLGFPELVFPFSELAVSTNQRMPLETLRLVRDGLGGSLANRRLLLLGISYRPDVADTRFTPAESFVRAAGDEGATVDVHDPLVTYWEELATHVPAQLPAAHSYDAVVFASAHPEYTSLDVVTWLGSARPLVVDGNRVLSDNQRAALRSAGVREIAIGRGAAPARTESSLTRTPL